MEIFITLVHELNVVEIKSPYDVGFLDDLKRQIPKHMRKWDSERKIWVVSNMYYLSSIKEVCSKYFSNVIVKEIWPVERFGDSFDELMLLLTKENKKSVYKALALIVHPDRGGSTRAMQLVNEIFGK